MKNKSYDPRWEKVVDRFISALGAHPTALRSLYALTSVGCDPVLLWQMLSAYQGAKKFSPFDEDRKEVSKIRASLIAVSKLLDKANVELDKVNSEICRLVQEEIGKLRDTLSRVIPKTKAMSDVRGTLRRELFLVDAVDYVRLQGGRAYYAELGNILEALSSADDSECEETYGEDKVRKIYERFPKRDNTDLRSNIDSRYGMKDRLECVMARQRLLEAVRPDAILRKKK